MKKLITLAVLTLAAVAARADLYLYWTTAESVFSNPAFETASYAQLFGQNAEGGYVSLGATVIGSSAYSSIGVSASPYVNYLIKLFDEADTAIGESATPVTYADLLASGAVWDRGSIITPPPMAPYSFSGIVVPEPTGGLLTTLGLALLALRRRRV